MSIAERQLCHETRPIRGPGPRRSEKCVMPALPDRCKAQEDGLCNASGDEEMVVLSLFMCACGPRRLRPGASCPASRSRGGCSGCSAAHPSGGCHAAPVDPVRLRVLRQAMQPRRIRTLRHTWARHEVSRPWLSGIRRSKLRGTGYRMSEPSARLSAQTFGRPGSWR